MKDINELYLAAGAARVVDGKTFITGDEFEPFEIVLKVAPKTFDIHDGKVEVTFDVLIPTSYTHTSGGIRFDQSEAELTLPIQAVHDLKKRLREAGATYE